MQAHKDWRRRDQLRELERRWQADWEASRLFEVDAGAQGEDKYFITFPYPYMNGLLHLGHGFSFSKAEFAAGYHRLKGKRVLLPFAFHVTGMPIVACAEKLKHEIATYGCPPKFHEDAPEPEASAEDAAAQEGAPEPAPPAAPAAVSAGAKAEKAAEKAAAGKFQGKKLKKASGKPQWTILKEMEIPEEDIPKFTSPDTWLEAFPSKALDDLRGFGARIDFRRSFLTTECNPFYDSFIQWQFRHLKRGNRLHFGKRFTIYSPKDGQPCQDHDRAQGEGVQAQEYTLILLEVQRPQEQQAFAPHAAAIEGKKVVLAAATLRPETMYGQTNCWVLPDGEYGAFDLGDGRVLVASQRCANNLSWQGIGAHLETSPPPLFTVKGSDLIGAPLAAPHATFPTVYALPMLTISMEKGTGIVTSVPSDAPDDYQALKDLKNKPEWRKKLGIKDEWVLPFDPVPIINIPEYGDLAAGTLCERFNVQSQKDQELLSQAKAEVYLKGFTDGVMLVEEWKGQRVRDVKPLLRQRLIDNGHALPYAEPESLVVSRSGDTCVVALCDQWYLQYGDPEWRDRVKAHITGTLECFNPSTKRGLEECVGWLGPHACSRTFGLGTRLPFDGADGFLIDSLSDSTIYMAFYTIAHLLQGGARHNWKEGVAYEMNVFGTKSSPSGIKPEELTDAVWDAIFLGTPSIDALDTTIDKEVLRAMRAEFLFWYPMNLRVSGKDLIQNHLTMCLYNHAAIFPECHWPRAIFCNGHILVDGAKMAKSTGNFLTLRRAVEEYSADATRLALADAGDGLDDANFVQSVANAQILKLTKELEWAAGVWATKDALRKGEYTFFDEVFLERIHSVVETADRQYSQMLFREAIQTCWFRLQNARDEYRQAVGGEANAHAALVEKFLEIQALLLSPITPHFSEQIWREILGRPASIHLARWPEVPSVDQVRLREAEYLSETIRNLRGLLLNQSKKGAPATVGLIYVTGAYDAFQIAAIEMAGEVWKATGGAPNNAEIAKKVAAHPELKENVQRAMGIVAVRLREAAEGAADFAFGTVPPVGELQLLRSQAAYVAQQMGLREVQVFDAADEAAADPGRQRARSEVGKPSAAFVA